MSARIREIQVQPRSLADFEPILGGERLAVLEAELAEMARRLEGRSLFTVTGEAWGGSIPENRRSLVQYSRGAGIDARWLVLEGPPEFFAVAAALRAAIQGGVEVDPGLLSSGARALYEKTLHENATELLASSRRNDWVVLHDPATAGMIGPLTAAGLCVVWRCHHSTDAPSECKARAWEFLAPDLPAARAFVFPRDSLAPPFCDRGRLFVVPTTLDPFSVKNRELAPEARQAILVHVGLLEPTGVPVAPAFEKADGTPGRVGGRAEVTGLGRTPRPDQPLVVQLGRWDAEKDFCGVLEGFRRMCEQSGIADATLLLAGADPASTSEGPQSRAEYERVRDRWRALPHAVRQAVRVAALPLADFDEHAAIVNAIQSHASVVVQKSLSEGVGLAVTEAMWKAKPVLASAVGGLREQIDDGVHGVLLEDPRDLDGFARSLRGLLDDPVRAARLGRRARERVVERHLDPSGLEAMAALVRDIDPS